MEGNWVDAHRRVRFDEGLEKKGKGAGEGCLFLGEFDAVQHRSISDGEKMSDVFFAFNNMIPPQAMPVFIIGSHHIY